MRPTRSLSCISSKGEGVWIVIVRQLSRAFYLFGKRAIDKVTLVSAIHTSTHMRPFFDRDRS